MSSPITTDLVDSIWAILEIHTPEGQKTDAAIRLIDAFEQAGADDLAETTPWLWASLDDDFVLVDLADDLDADMTLGDLSVLLTDYGYEFTADRINSLYARLPDFLEELQAFESQDAIEFEVA